MNKCVSMIKNAFLTLRHKDQLNWFNFCFNCFCRYTLLLLSLMRISAAGMA